MGQPASERKNEVGATVRHRAFAQEYVENGCNATAAHRKVYRAGRGAGNPQAASEIYRNPEVKKLIQERAEEALNAPMHELRYRVIQEVKTIAFAEISDYMTDGVVDLKKVAADSGAIRRIQMRTGDAGTTCTIELYDKSRALELLVRILGMDKDGGLQKPEVHVHLGEHARKWAGYDDP